MNKYIASSVDPSQLSTTISGLIIGMSALIIFGAEHFGIVIGTDQISQIAIILGTAISSLVTLYGLIRKVVVKATA
jgi:hypothetical protein